jgi:hypothetical protein
MVKSTHFRECHHATFRRRLDASWRGCVLLEGEMSSRPMVVERNSSRPLTLGTILHLYFL